MGKILVIAEKPSVARDIARVLKCTSKGDGYLYSDTYTVSWAIGHLVSLYEPEDYDEALKKWRAEALPIKPAVIRLKPIDRTKTQLNVLKKLMNAKDTDSIVCATDSGREGELIFRYIYDIAGCKKPFKRLWISSMTDAAVKKGFDTLKDGGEYDNLYYSAKCRSEADWLVGINATRGFTLKYDTLLSVGRVQTPTLAIIVKRQTEINVFVPVEYWEVKADFLTADNKTAYSGVWFDPETNENKIANNGQAESIAEKVRGRDGAVKDVNIEEKRQPPPLLYDLTELQRDCNRKFGFSAQKTLSVAQDLYEKKKAISYPRTDSRFLTGDMAAKAKDILRNLPPEAYKRYTDYVLGLDKPPVTKRIADDAKVSDHHAIIPTDIKTDISNFSPDEKKVYDLIARRFIAAFYPHYVYNAVKVISAVENEYFLTKGITVVSPGFTELYAGEQKNAEADADDDPAPDVKTGDKITVTEAQAVKKQTQPPKPYTEASLLSAMENAGRFVEDETLKEQLKDSGLGTPATRAAIIERLIHVGYIIRKGKALIPTDKGVKLVEVVPEELKSPETTGKWERGLNLISKGQMDAGKFMGSIGRYVDFLIAASKTGADVKFPEEKKPIRRSPDTARGKKVKTNAH